MSGEKKAHYQRVKEENKKLIRNLLLKKGVQGISGLAKESGLSYPTVSNLIGELAEEKQVLVMEEAESNGGRPGLRYGLNPDYRQGLVLTLMSDRILGVVYDGCGGIYGKYQENVAIDITAEHIVSIIAGIKAECINLTEVALGIPGAVNECRIIHLPRFPKLIGEELAKQIEEKLGLSFYLENDLNAIVLTEIEKYHDFAHIAWIEGCIGVGIVLGGQVLKGSGGYAGEVDGLFQGEEPEYLRLAKCMVALICILNLPHILLSGDIYDEELVKMALQEVGKRISTERIPEIHIVEDIKGLCQRGLLERILQKWRNNI